jgi:hypothetical protein
MKQFLYCEGTADGMETHYVAHPMELRFLLRGWMGAGVCKQADGELIEWMRSAQVGERHDHRLGLCVRLKDTE